jgi:hypothetical protein
MQIPAHVLGRAHRSVALPLVFSNTTKYNAHLFCSSCSHSILMSDAEKSVVDCATARSANAVGSSSFALPCSFTTAHIYRDLGRLGKKFRRHRLRLQR